MSLIRTIIFIVILKSVDMPNLGAYAEPQTESTGVDCSNHIGWN